MHDVSNPKKKKSIYRQYWEGLSLENAAASVDSHDERMCVACKFSCGKKQPADQRLDGQARKCQGPPPGYVFDR
jgi:hypothetical protein